MDIDDLYRQPAAAQIVFEGRFAETATTVDDVLHVRVPWLDSNRTGVPVEWAPRVGGSGMVLPQAGDRAWIAEAVGADGSSNAWIVVLWKPAS